MGSSYATSGGPCSSPQVREELKDRALCIEHSPDDMPFEVKTGIVVGDRGELRAKIARDEVVRLAAAAKARTSTIARVRVAKSGVRPLFSGRAARQRGARLSGHVGHVGQVSHPDVERSTRPTRRPATVSSRLLRPLCECVSAHIALLVCPPAAVANAVAPLVACRFRQAV